MGSCLAGSARRQCRCLGIRCRSRRRRSHPRPCRRKRQRWRLLVDRASRILGICKQQIYVSVVVAFLPTIALSLLIVRWQILLLLPVRNRDNIRWLIDATHELALVSVGIWISGIKHWVVPGFAVCRVGTVGSVCVSLVRFRVGHDFILPIASKNVLKMPVVVPLPPLA